MVAASVSMPAAVLVAALALACVFVAPADAVQTLAAHGAVSHNTTAAASFQNAAALRSALMAANASTSHGDDRVVLIAANADYTYFQVDLHYMRNVVLQIDGRLAMNGDPKVWPKPNPTGGDWSSLFLQDATNITIRGSGVWDGQGYDWWWDNILHGAHRPKLFVARRMRDFKMYNVRCKDSPGQHITLHDVDGMHVNGVSIMVHVDKQKEMLIKAGKWHPELSIPTFPLNTDGFDPNGINILIENVTIQNFDDAVAIKPSNGESTFSNCTQNVIIRDSYVVFGGGMSMGSVPPSLATNCIKNVTIDNVHFHNPLKAVYVKSDPGDEGKGIIDGITYKNLVVDGGLWYPIWIGPQQQDQPGGGTNTGCSFFYPFDHAKCPTQPRVAMNNILLQNITINKALFIPGVILCDPAAKCQNIVMENVVANGVEIIQKDYACHNADVTVKGTTMPKPVCTPANSNGTAMHY